jgi:transcriptional regulator with XRE-family HTH domain
MGVAEQLRQAILGSGESLNSLGKRAGVNHAALSRFTRGERSLSLPAVDGLCAALGLALAVVEAAHHAGPVEAPVKRGRPKKAPAEPGARPEPVAGKPPGKGKRKNGGAQ